MLTLLKHWKVKAVPSSDIQPLDIMERLDQRSKSSVWRTVREMEDIFGRSRDKGLNVRLKQRR